MSDDPIVKCSGCGADIVWQKTSRGARMPCDPKIITIVSMDGDTVRGRVSHFASCPDANKFRAPKEAKS